jgi:hypothetical protein
MYASTSVSGSLTIGANGQTVLWICDQDGEFANWLYSLMDELGNKPLSQLNERDIAWLKALNSVVERRVPNA